MSDAQETTPENEGGRVITVRLESLAETEARYANIVHVNSDLVTFQVIFSQATQPIILGPDDAKQIEEQGYIPARVVARLILTPTAFEQTIDVMQAQLKRYRQQVELVGDEPQEASNA